ncbi:unnamed protein product [Caenorhabditis auriculariae]|uniref:Galectin n=1 Tax=Caenorhabditis auriculariae TaxID=2777116 RepID=A0A8S1HKE5_9PELO|nr:unnamed protein product [Caenorhabditis auriculariae]
MLVVRDHDFKIPSRCTQGRICHWSQSTDYQDRTSADRLGAPTPLKRYKGSHSGRSSHPNMMKLLTVLFLGLSPAAYGYQCELLPALKAGTYPDLLERYIVMPKTLQVGDTIIINGKVGNGTVPFKRFTVDFFVGTKPVYYKTVSTLHLTGQYDLNTTFIGDYQPNNKHEFRRDKALPLVFTDDPSSVRIVVEADGYSIYKDNVFLHKLKYLKENYSTVQTIYLQNLEFHTECVIDCKEEKVCPSANTGKRTIIIGNRVVRYVDGLCSP